jgi:cytochrome c oxidase cbb3-type subunit III
MAMLEDHEHKHAVHNFDGIIENRVTGPPTYFSVLFFGLFLWAVIFAAYYLLSGWSSQADFAQKMAAHQQQVAQQGGGKPLGGALVAAAKPEKKSAEEQVAAGKQLFAQNCAACHGADATGGIGPDLTAKTFKFGRSRDAIATTIKGGRPGGMPAFGNQLSGEQIADLAAFIESLGGAPEAAAKSAVPGSGAPAKAAEPEEKEGGDQVAAGKLLFTQKCAACHGADATGGFGPDLTAKTFKFGRTRDAIATTIKGGRPGGMPAFGNQLSAEQIASLAAFIESL